MHAGESWMSREVQLYFAYFFLAISQYSPSTSTIVPVNSGMTVAPNSKSMGSTPVKVMVKVSFNSCATPSVTNWRLMLVSRRCSGGKTRLGVRRTTSLPPAMFQTTHMHSQTQNDDGILAIITMMPLKIIIYVSARPPTTLCHAR